MGEIDNPMAFPSFSGMTLRDYFAGQAFIGMMMKDPWGHPGTRAAYCYEAADAMLAARAAQGSDR